MKYSLQCPCGYETYTVENAKDLDYALMHAHMAFCVEGGGWREVKVYD